MSDGSPEQLDLVIASPGERLKAARLSQNMPEREVAARLNWMPSYVSLIEQDDYGSLRRPAFARGYVKAYAKLLELDEAELLEAFEHLQGEDSPGAAARRISGTRPAPLQRTGVGVVVGLVVLGLFLTGLWLWQGLDAEEPAAEVAPWAQDEQELNDAAGTLADS